LVRDLPTAEARGEGKVRKLKLSPPQWSILRILEEAGELEFIPLLSTLDGEFGAEGEPMERKARYIEAILGLRRLGLIEVVSKPELDWSEIARGIRADSGSRWRGPAGGERMRALAWIESAADWSAGGMHMLDLTIWITDEGMGTVFR
jgi:hypothetical protein